jgi:O-acetyl-ADP-ribose deacetylase (regulator of RNase III)
VAFPAISTGVYAYPKQMAAGVAVATLLRTVTDVEVTVLVAFDDETASRYRELLGDIG